MTWQEWAFVVFVVVMLIWSLRTSAALKTASKCEVCYRVTPICPDCGRCFDDTCNAGCVKCRSVIRVGPFRFGKKVGPL